MTMQFFEIKPTDTLFFRDGRPFNQDETITLAGVKSIFPPSPATVAGAIMAIYAKKMGWSGCGAWEKSIKDKLENKETPLIFSGVFLKKGSDILFPVPQHLIELRPNGKKLKEIDNKNPCQNKEEKNRKFNELHELAFLTPSKDTYKTDLGEVYLPEVKNQKDETVIKPLDSYWITQAGLEQCLKLKKPNESTLYHQSELWQLESKTGIERNYETHSVNQGMLYTSTHIRMCTDVSIVIGVENLPIENLKNETIAINNELMILGGEARTANITNTNSIDFSIFNFTKNSNLIYIASPTPVTDPQAIPNVKTACMPRQMRIGGWNSVTFKPLPLTPFLVPGTVLFMKTENTEVEKNWADDCASNEFKVAQINKIYGQSFFGEC
ncbi:hypothetical protein THERMOT_1902 [Bathymodiolus thermophilus thioautotrophic gill symbiont]|uniref:type III-B CRISPR module-associated Cmr3 family protein n=1 Tax=Bathymodiolus thermophilus thioautotrophic gill symbiont TaxID=2360 RepID=UPI00192B1716|nr:type III-B CRISPR module-associated Cmr3 family protein [Bathymodiolus thermophilus thioautotrophic gill symbiont]CAB5504082.1 hypothetical protein THERMOT_1902 [Bathymodiolus thermophilus thioautotrophic gill symbiont]